uniref:Uncharacterized protein AlNc14C325G10627 n=1 Tax=Albugo laibachii Nc14 TaxID=890382 RepID=F0WWL5_9STRA|nr:conserved hypothetical protein [Albugo laibachii Nc14]|eukprot:CCA25839.1 conserved hypothetical protein [Albugo laibachii Nc14]
MNTQSTEFQAALCDHANALGVDPVSEQHLLPIVQEALLAELPVGWEQGQTDDGMPYYFHAESEKSTWEHPLDEHYRQQVLLAKVKTHRWEGPCTPSLISHETENNNSKVRESIHITMNKSMDFGRDTSWLLDEELVIEKPLVNTAEAMPSFTKTDKMKLENDLEETRIALQKSQQTAKETSYYKMKFGDLKISYQRLKKSSHTLETALADQVAISKERFECLCMAEEEVLKAHLQIHEVRLHFLGSKKANKSVQQEIEHFKSITKQREIDLIQQLETLQLQQTQTKSQETEDLAQVRLDAQNQLALERSLSHENDQKQILKLQEELHQSMVSLLEAKEIAQKRLLEVQELQLLILTANTRASSGNEEKLAALGEYEISRQQYEQTVQALKMENRRLESALEQEQLSLARFQEQAEKWHHCEHARIEDQLTHTQRQLSDAEGHKRELQNQVSKLQDQSVALNAKWQAELVDAQQQAQEMCQSQTTRLEKQLQSLERELQDALDGFQDAQKKLRETKQELSLEKHHTQQVALDLEDKKRWEASLRHEKEKLAEERHSAGCQLASLQADYKSLKQENADEKERFLVRIRELESRLKQKEYDILRVEECATKAECWRQKEAKRVEERDLHLLRLSEEIAQSKQQNLAEPSLKKDLLDAQNALCDLQRHYDDREAQHQKQIEELHQSIALQLPQLATKCVSRASEEWTKKCKEMMRTQRESLSKQANDERETLIRTFQIREEEWTKKHARVVEVSEVLRRDLRKMEYLNELLTQQLQMQWTQRSASQPRTISVPPYKSNKRVSMPWPKVAWEQPIQTIRSRREGIATIIGIVGQTKSIAKSRLERM